MFARDFIVPAQARLMLLAFNGGGGGSEGRPLSAGIRPQSVSLFKKQMNELSCGRLVDVSAQILLLFAE